MDISSPVECSPFQSKMTLPRLAAKAAEIIPVPALRASDVNQHYQRSAALRTVGTLAHSLIAQVWPVVAYDPAVSNAEVIEHMKDLVRVQGFALDGEYMGVLQRCLRTLRGPLWDLHQKAPHFSFEEPIRLLTPTGIMEGKIDLVARHATAWYVVEFKSAHEQAKSQHSLQQLSYYAQALSKHTDVPIKCAPCHIGNSAPLAWELYSPTKSN